MKRIMKSLAVVAAAVVVAGFGANEAKASDIGFSLGVNVGVPVVAAHVYAPAPPPVYVSHPARVYPVRHRCDDHGYYRHQHNGYGHGGYYKSHDRGLHRGWYKEARGYGR